MKKCDTCHYSKAMNQPQPRLCIHCNTPENYEKTSYTHSSLIEERHVLKQSTKDLELKYKEITKQIHLLEKERSKVMNLILSNMDKDEEICIKLDKIETEIIITYEENK